MLAYRLVCLILMESFKNLILPDFVIAALYTAPLVQDGASAPVMRTTGEPVSDGMLPDMPVSKAEHSGSKAYRYLGKNNRKVSVIARYPDDPYIPEEHLQFLVKILSACKLNLGDVAILNDSVAPIEIDNLRKQLQPAYILMFDVEPTEIGLPISFPLMKPQNFDGAQLLCIPPIAAMLQETDLAKGLKKQLWESLKQIFVV